MFEGIKAQCKRVSDLQDSVMLQEILEEPDIEAQIIDLNQDQLYNQGIQADGSPTGDYAPITITKYKPLAAAEGRDGRSDHITGKDTGETYASMKTQSVPGGFKITADDRNNFFDREPEGLGLTDESLQQIIPEINQRMIDKVAQAIGI